MGDIHWKLIWITIAIAVGSLLIQILLKHSSRPHAEGRKSSVTLDDWIVWTDWAVLGGLSFVLSLFAYKNHGGEAQFPIGTMIWGCAFLLAQLLLFPQFLRAFAYEDDPSDPSKVKIKGVAWVATCDVVGGILLASVVQSGINVYDWTGSGL